MTLVFEDPSLSAYLTARGTLSLPAEGSVPAVPEATTIVAVRHSGGREVSMIADRRASAGHLIAHDDMTKVCLADRECAVGVAGTAGLGLEMTRLFALELEHVEKIERRSLSFESKVRRLSHMVRQHLPMAMKGLSAIPILAGWDAVTHSARVVTFDATGGAYEEEKIAAIGSGSELARAVVQAEGDTLEASADEARAILLKALAIAARRDMATAGPDSSAGAHLVHISHAGATRDHVRGSSR